MRPPRVELQAELSLERERVFPLLSSAAGLRVWLDEAELDARPGAAVRLRLRDAVAEGKVVAYDPPQHLSFSWDYPADRLGAPSVVAFDVIAHGRRSHVTLRHVGFRSPRQLELHEALWRYWFGRFLEAAQAARAVPPA